MKRIKNRTLKTMIVFFILLYPILCLSQHRGERLDLYPLSGTFGVFHDYRIFKIFTSEKQLGTIIFKPDYVKMDSGRRYRFSGFEFFGKDKLVCSQETEVVPSDYGERYLFSDIVVTDYKGEVREKLTNNELLSSHTQFYHSFMESVSPSGSKLLFYSNTHVPPRHGGQLSRAELEDAFIGEDTYHIMDYATKKIVFSTVNFGKKNRSRFGYRPWSPDEKKLLYTIDYPFDINIKGQQLGSRDSSEMGTYVFDLEKKQDVKYIPMAVEPSWNPHNSLVVYLLNSDIWIYDFDKDTHKLFLKSDVKNGFHIGHVRWNPEGDHLFVQCVVKRKKTEKLYRLSDGQDIKFKKLDIGHSRFIWE